MKAKREGALGARLGARTAIGTCRGNFSTRDSYREEREGRRGWAKTAEYATDSYKNHTLLVPECTEGSPESASEVNPKACF